MTIDVKQIFQSVLNEGINPRLSAEFTNEFKVFLKIWSTLNGMRAPDIIAAKLINKRVLSVSYSKEDKEFILSEFTAKGFAGAPIGLFETQAEALTALKEEK